MIRANSAGITKWDTLTKDVASAVGTSKVVMLMGGASSLISLIIACSLRRFLSSICEVMVSTRTYKP